MINNKLQIDDKKRTTSEQHSKRNDVSKVKISNTELSNISSISVCYMDSDNNQNNTNSNNFNTRKHSKTNKHPNSNIKTNSISSILGFSDNSIQLNNLQISKRSHSKTSTTNKNIITIKLTNSENPNQPNTGLNIDLSLAEKGYPDILSNIDYDNKTLYINNHEKWLDYKTLKNYYTYVKRAFNLFGNGTNHGNSNNSNTTRSKQQTNNMNSSRSKMSKSELTNLNFNFKKLTQLANYFESPFILSCIIQYNIEPNINVDTCISLINDAFKYCSNPTLNSNLKSKWFNLFMKLRSFIVLNFNYFLNDNNKSKVLKLHYKLLEELIESYLLDIYTKGFEITKEQATQIVLVILHLRNANSSSNNNNKNGGVLNFENEDGEVDIDQLFTLLSNEKVYLQSPSNISELSNNFNTPTYSVNLLKDINFNYQEKIIQFYKQELIFIEKYDSINDIFTITLKLNPINQIDVFSFLSYGVIIEDAETPQINFYTLNTNNEKNIFTIQSFKTYVNYMKGIKELSNVNLIINLKFCIIQSFLICYLKSIFEQTLMFNRPNIRLLPVNVLCMLLLQNNYREENVIEAIMTWLNDSENNTADNLDELFEVFDTLDWKKVPLGKIFEFIIRFPNVLHINKSVENMIIAAMFSKANDKLREMKKERIYSERILNGSSYNERNNGEFGDNNNNYGRKNTQFSYEGEYERCEAILNNEIVQQGGNEKRSEVSGGGGDNVENYDVKLKDENVIHLIAYFTVNLIECSKKLDFQKIVNYALNLQREVEINRKMLNNNKDNNIEQTNHNRNNKSRGSIEPFVNNSNNQGKENYFNLSNITKQSDVADGTSSHSNNIQIINNKINTCDHDLNKMPTIHVNVNSESPQKKKKENSKNKKESPRKQSPKKKVVINGHDDGVDNNVYKPMKDYVKRDEKGEIKKHLSNKNLTQFVNSNNHNTHTHNKHLVNTSSKRKLTDDKTNANKDNNIANNYDNNKNG